MIDDRSLLDKINAEIKEFQPCIESYLLYGGFLDPDKGIVHPLSKDFDRKNMNPRDSMNALFRAYPHAVKLLSLISLYTECPSSSAEEKEALERWVKQARATVDASEDFMGYLLSKLPNEIA